MQLVRFTSPSKYIYITQSILCVNCSVCFWSSRGQILLPNLVKSFLYNEVEKRNLRSRFPSELGVGATWLVAEADGVYHAVVLSVVGSHVE